MQQRIDQRLAQLSREYEQGYTRLMQMERERAELRETLVRIQGAILALKELATDADKQDRTGPSMEETAEVCMPVPADSEAVKEEYSPQSIEE